MKKALLTIMLDTHGTCLYLEVYRDPLVVYEWHYKISLFTLTCTRTWSERLRLYDLRLTTFSLTRPGPPPSSEFYINEMTPVSTKVDLLLWPERTR
jgi:hypothetical protein